jgi:cell wall-associated NlpC family hydrolase
LRSPNRRPAWLAGLALALLLISVFTPPGALASESRTTVHIRGEEEPDSDQSNDPNESGMLEVSEREGPAMPTSNGASIVEFALAYVGYPYAWAGNSPAGFDCAGFAQFVILNVLGVNIGHAIEGQPAAGAWVDWGAWEPGDLVFFQNTYRAGLSHVGIYIGDGLFVHAENEGTGVTISSMYSDYYGPRYWGAVRPA